MGWRLFAGGFGVGPKDPGYGILLIFMLPAVIALLIAWRREVACDPAMVPAGLLAVCALFSCLELMEWSRLGEFDRSRAGGFAFLFGAAGWLFFAALAGTVTQLVYLGTHATLVRMFPRMRPK